MTSPGRLLYIQLMVHHEVLNCAGFNLRAATRSLTRRYDAALAPAGILSTQFSLLNFVEGKEPRGIAELAEVMEMDISTVTRNLAPLSKTGLITVAPSASDGRRKEVRITARGRRALAKARPLWLRAQDETLHKLGTNRYRELLSSLEAIRSLDPSA